MSLVEFDRWLRFRLLENQYIFTIPLSMCIDEWGYSYGKNATNPLVLALKSSKKKHERINFLKGWYANKENQLQNYNDISGRNEDDEIGSMYFCPWEQGRVRPLDKFLKSHKVGPTSDESLPGIISRLESVLKSISYNGYNYKKNLNTVMQVIKLINQDGKIKYIIRDGQHRSAVLSYLGIKNIPVCFSYDYYSPSILFKYLFKIIKKSNFNDGHNLSIVDASNVAEWPHVKSGNTTVSEALKYFECVFNKSDY